MSALSIQPTYPIFTDIDGQPLEDGYVWIGVANLDPQTNPINVYWDAALTILAPQPIRTLAGYPSNNGTPARLYVNSDYSIRVMNKNGSTVYSAPAATERYSDVVVSGVNADDVIYDPPFANAVQTNVEAKLAQVVNVKDFGAIGDGVTDDTSAIQTAFDTILNGTYTSIYIPTGDYVVSTLDIPDIQALVVYGDGPSSLLRITGAGVKYSKATPPGQSFTTIRDLGFQGSLATGNSLEIVGWNGFLLENLYFINLGVNQSAIYINGSAGADMHEGRLSNIRVYANQAAHSAIRFGPLATDCMVDQVYVDGNQQMRWGMYFDAGSDWVHVSNTYLTNVADNCLNVVGSSQNLNFTNCQFDFALKDNVYIGANSFFCRFTNCFFAAIQATYSAIYLDSAFQTGVVNCYFNTATAASAAVNEAGTSDWTRIVGCSSDNVGLYVSGVWFLNGANSSVVNGAETLLKFGDNVLVDVDDTFAGTTTITLNNATNATRIELKSQGAAAGYIATDTTKQLYFGAQGNASAAAKFDASSNFVPAADNSFSCGSGTNRWSVIYSATPAINTSDARSKQQDRPLTEKERAVAVKVKGLIKSFKFNDAVELKNDNARIHFGVYAQDVEQAFASEGLDARDYALFCYDEWEDQPAVYDGSGNLIQAAVTAGNRYGVRYEELLAFVITAL